MIQEPHNQTPRTCSWALSQHESHNSLSAGPKVSAVTGSDLSVGLAEVEVTQLTSWEEDREAELATAVGVDHE